MKIVCVGGGPAGLYLAILAKLADPDHEIVVVERERRGSAFGLGALLTDDLFDDLYRNDPQSAREIWDSCVHWQDHLVHVGRRPPAHLGGYGFSLARHRLLEILGRRARQLGVDIQFGRAVTDLAELGD